MRAGEDRLAADHDVGRDVEIVEEVQLLVHEGDAAGDRLAHGEGPALLPVEADPPGAGLHHPAEDLHEGALAGAVLADQPDDLAASEGEADRIQGGDARIDLGDVLELEEGLVHRSDAGRRHPRKMAPALRDAGWSYLAPVRCFSSAQKASTLDWSMILVGMMMRPLAGMPDLSPSRYLAISFMPW